MRLRLTSLALALIVLVAAAVHAQPPTVNQTRETPAFRVQVWGYLMADFSTRVSHYVALRSELEQGLPPLTVTNDPAKIRQAVTALAKRIRVKRAAAKQGDIFTPAITVDFRRAFIIEMNPNTCAAIMDDNPGAFSSEINGDYPEKKPLSTVTPNILAALPQLPADIQYRFLGRHLILLDTRASLIVDRLPYAIECSECGESSTCHR